MFQEILLIVIVVAGGIATSRLWPRHKLLAGVVCVLAALLVPSRAQASTASAAASRSSSSRACAVRWATLRLWRTRVSSMR